MPRIRVLLADDHALIRAGLRETLSSMDELLVVGEVENGIELEETLRELKPDLLVVDVSMPDFSPVTALRNIRNIYPDLKILVISAYNDKSNVVNLLSVGINGYHLKDQSLSDFHHAIKRVLEGGRWISDPLVDKLIEQNIATTDSSEEIILTRRQRELLYFLTQGYNNQKIARVLNLSIKTVESHLTSLYRALQVEGRLEASNFGIRRPDFLYISEEENLLKMNELKSAETLSVLMVDDNSHYRTQLGKLVTRACPSCSLFEAEDSEEAQRIAKTVKPDLAFVDVVLEDEDGIQCVKRIKEISSNTRMILISAYPDWGLRQSGFRVGAIAYLDKKDIDGATIMEIISDTLELN